MDSPFIPLQFSQETDRLVVHGGSHFVYSAFAVQLAGSLWPLQVCQFLSDQCWLPGKSHLGEGPALPGPGSSTGEARTGTWKTRRLGQKERTPLGNL